MLDFSGTSSALTKSIRIKKIKRHQKPLLPGANFIHRS